VEVNKLLRPDKSTIDSPFEVTKALISPDKFQVARSDPGKRQRAWADAGCHLKGYLELIGGSSASKGRFRRFPTEKAREKGEERSLTFTRRIRPPEEPRHREIGAEGGHVEGCGRQPEREARAARFAPSEIRRVVKRERRFTGGDQPRPAADQTQPELQQGSPPQPRVLEAALQDQQRAVV